MREVLLVQVEATAAAALRANAPAETLVAEVSSPASALEVLRDGNRDIAATIVGPQTSNPIHVAQRAHAMHPGGAVLILADRARLDDVRRAIQFAPFISDLTACYAPANNEELVAEVAKVVDLVSRRKRLQAVVQTAPARIFASAPRATGQQSAAPPTYLGALLDVAPIGIVALDPELRVAAMNPFATRLFGVDERDALGTPLTRLFAFDDEARVRALVVAADGSPGAVFRGTRASAHYTIEVKVARAERHAARNGFLVVAEDVTERAGLVERLEKAVRMRDEFLSIASHELKTPIAALKLNVQLLTRKVGAGHPLAPLGARIEHAIARVTRLIEDLLEVTRVSSGVLTIDAQPTDLVALVRDALLTVEGVAEDAGCELRLSGAEQLTVDCDQRRVEQVVTNLLTNAIKFGRGKPIDVEVSAGQDAAVLSVRDRGIGIAESDQARIFNQFERAVGQKAFGGWGLGLWISKRIIESHGGTIGVASTPGGGATFTVRLPVRAQ